MDDYKRFPATETRQIIDYNRFMSLTGEKVFICLDKGVLEIAKYLLNTRGTWRSTYVKEYDTLGYYMPTIEEFNNVQQAIAEANIDMASCEDIVEAIRSITSAITVNAGNSGCGCIGSGNGDVTGVNDRPTESIPGSAEWEEAGFSSEEAYESHKCNVAQEIIQNYIATLRNWAGLFGVTGGITLAIITGLLLLTVPPAGLMLIVAAFGLLVGTDIGLLVNLSTIAGNIEDDIDNLRCELYNAESTGDAATIIRDAAQAAVEALSLGIMEGTFIQITDNLISNEEIAKLFDPAYTTSVTGSDCTACSDLPECFVINNGTITSGTIDPLTETFVVASVAGPDVGGSARYWINMRWVSGCGCIKLGIVSSGFTSGNLGSSHGIGNVAWFCGEETYIVELSADPDIWDGLCFEGEDSIQNLQFNSRTPFEIEFTVQEIGCS